MSQTPPMPANPETEPYWAAVREGRLLVKSCPACGARHVYPRAGCPFCFAERTEWLEASGVGEIYSFSVLRGPGEPSILAYVTLDEGPTMMTEIVDCAPDTVAIGQRVRLVVRPGRDGSPAPMFTAA